MAREPMAITLDQLKASLSDIRRSCILVERAVELRPRLEQYLKNRNLIQAADNKLIQDFIGAECDITNTIEGLVVRLVASFETFLRQLIRDGVRILNDAALTYDSLDESLKNHDRYLVGIALTKISKQVDRWPINFDQLCFEIGTCAPGASKVILSAEAFAIGVGGITVEHIEKAFSSLGAHLTWDPIARDQKVKKALTKITGARKLLRTCDAKKALCDVLNDLRKQRNRYAHRTGGAEISAEYIKDRVELLSPLGDALRTYLLGKLAT